MNKFALSKHKFGWLAAAVVVAASLYLALSFPALNRARHNWADSLVSDGTNHTGTARLAWYELAHVVAPRDPTVGLTLAQAYEGIGRANPAIRVLERYPHYLPAVALRGQLLVQEGKFGQAATVLQPVAGQSAAAAYWDAQALAEQGSGATSWEVLLPYIQGGNVNLTLLYDYLRLAGGQTANAAVGSSEAAQALATAQQGIIPLATELYRLRLLNTAERVLETGSVASPASWALHAEIASSQQPPEWKAAEVDYWQALILDPTNTAIKDRLVAVAKQLGDKPMLARVAQQQAQLPVR